MATFDELLSASQPVEAQAMTGSFDDLVNTEPTGLRPLSEKRGGFVASVKRTVGQGIQGAGQLAADIVPGVEQDNAVTQYGREVIEANPTEVNTLADIPRKPLTAVTEATGNAAASMAGIIGLRALGQGVTALSPMAGPAAPVVAGVGQLISWLGPTAIAALPSYGGIRDKQIVDSPEAQTSAKDKAIAALGAGTVGFIEQRFGPQNWGAAVLTKEGRARLAKMFAGSSRLGAVGKGLASGAAIEGAEEIVQNPVEQLASYQDPRTPENVKETVFGGAMGAIGGGVLGGGMGGVSYRSQKTKDTIQQRTLSNLIKGADVSVEGGVATIARGQELPFSMPVETLAAHLADGGTIDTLTREQRYGERGIRFRRPEDTATATIDQDAAQGAFDWRSSTQGSLRYRQNANAPRGLFTPAESEQRPAVSRVPGVPVEEVMAAEQAYQTGVELSPAPQTITRKDGTPFKTQRAAESAVKRFKLLEGSYDIQKNKDGFTVVRKGEQDGPVRDIPVGEGEEVRGGQSGVSEETGRTGEVSGVVEQAPPAGSRPSEVTSEAATENVRGRGRGAAGQLAAQEAGAGGAEIDEVAAAQADYAAFQKQESNLAKPPKPPKEKAPTPKTTGVKVRFTGTGGGPQVVEVVRKEPPQPGDLPGEEFYTVVNTQTGESGVVSAEDITPVKGQEEAFTNISNAVDKSSEPQYSTSESTGTAFQYRDMGEDTSEEGKKSAAHIRKVLLSAKQGSKDIGNISTRQVSGAVLSAADRVAQVFGRRVVFFASDSVSAKVPNGFIDKNDPKTIYINTKSGFSPLTILGHEILHAMRTERKGLYDMLYAAAKNNIKLKAFDAYRAKLKESGYHTEEKLTKEYVAEEMLADFMGDSFADPAFWEQLAQEKPTLFKRLVAFVKAFLDDAVKTFQGLKNFQSDQFFIDVQKMRDVAVKAMAQYGGAEAFVGMEPMDIRFSFSIADGALDLGRKKVKEAASSLANPKSRLHELYVQYAPQWLSVTPLLTLVQTFGKKFPQVAEFARHIDRVVAVKNDIVNKSKELHDEALALAKDGVGEKVLNYAIGTSSFNRMTPWKSLMEQDWVPKTGTAEERLKLANVAWKRAKMDEATGLKLHEAYKQARDAYEALGTDAMKTAYEAMVDDLHRVREREKNNLLSFIEQASVGNTALRQQLMARFNATFSELQGAYWPLARVGDFTLSFTEKDGTKVVKHYVTTKLRRLDRDQLIEDGIDPAAITEGTKDKRSRSESAIPQELMSQLMGAVEAEKMQDVGAFVLTIAVKGKKPVVKHYATEALRRQAKAQMIKDGADAATIKESIEDEATVEAARAAALEEAQDVVSDMNQIWLRWQPETAALKNSLRRKNVRGFSEDMMRSYLDYMSRHASNIAWTEQGRKIEATLKSMAEDIKEAKAAGGADTTMQQNILNDLRGRVQAIREARVGPVASGLGKLGTAYYMTSPSIALVQLSQLAVITFPNMAIKFQKLGLRAVTKALAGATKAAFTKEFTRKAIFSDPVVEDIFDRLHAVVTEQDRATSQGQNKDLGSPLYSKPEILKLIEQLTPYQRQLLALREATARNLLDISAAHEAYELTQGKDPNGLMSKAFRYAMLPMQLSELASRKAAVLGTMDLATQEKKDFFEAMNDVASVVNDTLYSYAKEHKGSALQGGAARVLLQFQHYRIMTIIRLMSLFSNSVRGETPEMKSAARKELIGILGMTGALGGSLGLPLAGVIFTLSNALLGDDDEPIDSELMWRNWLRENFGATLGNVLTTGVPYLVGADLSRRVGMGDMFGMQQTPPPGYHGAKLFTWWATSLLGPVASVGQSGFQGYDEIVNKGNYMKGLEVATPKPIRDALKAIRLGTEGLKTSSGKRLLAEDAIGVDELFLAALGFNPEEVSRAQAAERSLNKMSTLISERRGRIIRDAARGILEGDTREAMQSVLQFNSRMPRYTIQGGDIKGSVRKIISGEIGDAGLRDRQVAAQYEIPSYL